MAAGAESANRNHRGLLLHNCEGDPRKDQRSWNDGSVVRASAALAEDLDSIPAPTQNSQLSLVTPAPGHSPQAQSIIGTHTEISLQKREFALGTYCKE